MAFFLILQSHLKDIQSAFVSVLSDSDGKYCCILELCLFVVIQQTGGNLSTGIKSTALCRSTLKYDCRNFPFLMLIKIIYFLGIMYRDKKHMYRDKHNFFVRLAV